jgi:hypothetical protein
MGYAMLRRHKQKEVVKDEKKTTKKPSTKKVSK